MIDQVPHVSDARPVHAESGAWVLPAVGASVLALLFLAYTVVVTFEIGSIPFPSR